MPRKPAPLTNTEVKQAKPKEKEYNLSDGDGLALRVSPNGSKLWVFNYSRPYTKKRANLGFGRYPDVSLAQARQERSVARELLAKGIDPKTHKDEIRAQKKNTLGNTLEVVARQWFELKKKEITADYAEDIINSLQNHVFPKLGKMPLADISAPLVIEALNPLAKVGKLEMIKRICSRLNQIMTFAVNTGVVFSNPLVGVRHAFETPTVTNNPTLKPDEMPILLEAIAEASILKVTRYLILWQLHTMARPGEAAGAKWSEIDWENLLWVVPPERMKKRREHIVPLTPQTIALLEKIKPISGRGEYIFPSNIDLKKCANSSTVNVALKRMGFSGRLTAHGMRALASTTLNEQQHDPELIEVALAHIDKNTVRAAYNRAQHLERRRKMMEWWSEHIVKAATGNLSMASGVKGLRVIN